MLSTREGRAMALRYDETVPKDSLIERFAEIIEAANGEHGPVAISAGGEVVGYFVGCRDMEHMHDLAIGEMLDERMKDKGPTFSTEEVMAQMEAIIVAAEQRQARKA
jgi:hypothetical protein